MFIYFALYLYILFEKADPTNKGNCRRISVMHSVSKILKKVLFAQLSDFSSSCSIPLYCRYGERYSP